MDEWIAIAVFSAPYFVLPTTSLCDFVELILGEIWHMVFNLMKNGTKTGQQD